VQPSAEGDVAAVHGTDEGATSLDRNSRAQVPDSSVTHVADTTLPKTTGILCNADETQNLIPKYNPYEEGSSDLRVSCRPGLSGCVASASTNHFSSASTQTEDEFSIPRANRHPSGHLPVQVSPDGQREPADSATSAFAPDRPTIPPTQVARSLVVDQSGTASEIISDEEYSLREDSDDDVLLANRIAIDEANDDEIDEMFNITVRGGDPMY
jgi:hypothetical protein